MPINETSEEENSPKLGHYHCEVPSIEFGILSIYTKTGLQINSTSMMEPGSRLHLNCSNIANSLGGSAETTCQQNGTWLPTLGHCSPDEIDMNNNSVVKDRPEIETLSTMEMSNITLTTNVYENTTEVLFNNYANQDVEELLLWEPEMDTPENQNMSINITQAPHNITLKDLYDCIRSPLNFVKIEAILKDNVEWLEGRNEIYETPLMHSIRKNSLEYTEFFINKGAHLEAENLQGQTPLLLAAELGYARIIELLLYTGANLSFRDWKFRRSALIWAAHNGHLNAVKTIVQFGADPTEKSGAANLEDEDSTTIHHAAQFGHVDIVDYLLEIDPTIKVEMLSSRNRKMETPLIVASAYGKINVVGHLVGKYNASLEERSKYNQTALLSAVEHNQIGVVRYLLRNNADIKAKCFGQRTALHLATEHNHLKMVQLLINEEVSLLEEENAYGNAPLFIASEIGNKDLVENLLNSGASLSKIGHLGRTALHAAAFSGHRAVLKLLASVDKSKIWSQSRPEDNGDMAIHLAIRNHHLDVVKLLINIDEQQIEAQNIHSYTPLQLATMIGDSSSACYIASLNSDKNIRDGSGKTPLISAAENGDDDIVECLVSNGANVTAKSGLQDNFQTALHAAATKGSLRTIKYLVNVSKETLELRESSGGTPLTSAVMTSQINAVKLLVELGANMEAATFRGIKTPLWIASSNGDTEIVKFLVEKGANKEAIGEYGRTPLLAAAGNLAYKNKFSYVTIHF